MMSEAYIDLAVAMLEDMHASGEEQIDRSSIQRQTGEQAESFIQMMESADLLEIEGDPDIYFITPLAYELLESKSLRFYLKGQAGLLEDEDFRDQKEEDDDGFPRLIHLEALARPGGRSVYSTILLFALVMAVVMVISNGLRPSSNKEAPLLELSEEEQQAILDSANAYLQSRSDSLD